MAASFTEIASAGSTSGSSATWALTVTAAVSAGKVVAVGSASGNDLTTGDYSLSSVADTRGNTYTVHATANRGLNIYAGCASSVLTTGLQVGDTITLTFTASCEDRAGKAWQVDGIDATGSRVDATGTVQDLSNTATASATGTVTDGVGLAVFGWNRNTNDTAISAPATSLGTVIGTGGDTSDARVARLMAGWIQGTSTTTSITSTAGASVKVAGVIVVFKAAAGGGGTNLYPPELVMAPPIPAGRR